MLRITDTTEMLMIRIAEKYPNEYTLVKIVEIDHENGRETGIALYTAGSMSELDIFAKNEGLLSETTIVQGENLVPMIGGLL